MAGDIHHKSTRHHRRNLCLFQNRYKSINYIRLVLN